jgi:hypothetical protein
VTRTKCPIPKSIVALAEKDNGRAAGETACSVSTALSGAYVERVKLTWRSTQILTAAKGDSGKYCPTRARWTGVSSRYHTNIPQGLEHKSAYKQNADDTSGFVIELLRQTMASQASQKQLQQLQT